MRDIGKNIRLLREQKGLTQEDFAQQLFVTRQTVSNYETGRTHPDIDTLEKIAVLLDSDLNTLIYGSKLPEVRKNALKSFRTASIFFCLLLLSAAIFYFIGTQQMMTTYNVWPLLVFRLVLRPLIFLTGGWWILDGLSLITRLAPIRTPWSGPVRNVLLGILVLVSLLFASAFVPKPPMPPALVRLMFGTTSFFVRQYWVYLPLGGLLWLFRKIY